MTCDHIGFDMHEFFWCESLLQVDMKMWSGGGGGGVLDERAGLFGREGRRFTARVLNDITCCMQK